VKRLLIAISMGSLFAIGGLAATLSGTISDSVCAAKHEPAAASDVSCVQRCVKRGAAPVLVSDGKVYQISADSRDKVKDVRGLKVTVNGKVDGDTVTIESVQAAK